MIEYETKVCGKDSIEKPEVQGMCEAGLLDAGWQPAPSTTFTKQQLSFSNISIKEAGYLYTWLSYDDNSNNWVYFDDFKVTHTKGNIVQYNEYYR